MQCCQVNVNVVKAAMHFTLAILLEKYHEMPLNMTLGMPHVCNVDKI